MVRSLPNGVAGAQLPVICRDVKACDCFLAVFVWIGFRSTRSNLSDNPTNQELVLGNPIQSICFESSLNRVVGILGIARGRVPSFNRLTRFDSRPNIST